MKVKSKAPLLSVVVVWVTVPTPRPFKKPRRDTPLSSADLWFVDMVNSELEIAFSPPSGLAGAYLVTGGDSAQPEATENVIIEKLFTIRRGQ